MSYYPIFADLHQRRVVVIGAGEVAARKVVALLKAGASVCVVSPTLNTELNHLHKKQRIHWLPEKYQARQLDQAFLVIAATNNPALNAQVSADADKYHTLVNVVDDQSLCSFIVPAIIDRSPVQIAISTAGTAPVLARLWRERLEAEIPQHLGKLAALAGRFRERVKQQLNTLTERRRFWENFFTDQSIHHKLSSNKDAEAEKYLTQTLTEHRPKAGEVTLVGAGPGDASLLTLGGLQAIRAADVVFYDSLVSKDVLELIRRDAKKIDVGKRAGSHTVAQSQTNQLLLEHAKAGQRVVRLKGGDPFIFGRGGEECQVLAEAGIDFRVIPGITAAASVTAYAGIPLTHRDYAQTAVFITGACQEKDTVNWQALALSHQTLVVYMGIMHASEITAQLIRHGRQTNTPVAVISRGSTTEQQTQLGQLWQLPDLTRDAPRPALIIIGEVVSLQSQLSWYAHDVFDRTAPEKNNKYFQ